MPPRISQGVCRNLYATGHRAGPTATKGTTMAVMAASWDEFDLNTPDWTALYFIDAMLRQSRDPHYEVWTGQPPYSPGPIGNPRIVARQDNKDLIVTIFCDDYPGEHRTRVCLVISSANDLSACSTELTNLKNEIMSLPLG
jgi:hypothetical protein